MLAVGTRILVGDKEGVIKALPTKKKGNFAIDLVDGSQINVKQGQLTVLEGEKSSHREDDADDYDYEEDEDEDGDDEEKELSEDAEVKALVENSVQTIKASSASMGSKTFSRLHARLLKAGQIKAQKLSAGDNGCIVENASSGSRNPIEDAQNRSLLYDGNQTAAPSLRRAKPDNEKKKSLGKGWFDLVPAKLDDDLKRDIKIIQMRNYLDPKRFYKNPDKLRSVLHIGTVVEGPTEFMSARLTRKERKQSIVDEILADKQIKCYTKRKYLEIQQEKAGSNKRKAFKGKNGTGGSNTKKHRKLF